MTVDRVVRKSLSEDFTLRASRKPGMGLAALPDIISLSFFIDHYQDLHSGFRQSLLPL